MTGDHEERRLMAGEPRRTAAVETAATTASRANSSRSWSNQPRRQSGEGRQAFGFAALVVVGDGKGRVGYGPGKAREVPEAIRKATELPSAMIRVPLREGRTLHHDVLGHYGAGKVVLRAAPPGTGIIAGGPMRAVFEALGMQDVVAKSVGTSNPHNMVNATFAALKNEDSPRSVGARRGLKVSTLQARRRDADTSEAADAS